MRVTVPLLCALIAGSGCATSVLNRARTEFYAGRMSSACEALNRLDENKADEVLLRMERGMVLKSQGLFAESSSDFIKAADELERLRTYSISQGAASMLVNDNVQDFTGFPFEQVLLHAFTAENHFALRSWDNGAVESRRIVRLLDPERLGKYPEDAYSRYVAALGFEMIDDQGNARIQYMKAARVCSTAAIEEDGRLSMHGDTPDSMTNGAYELICLVSAGRVPRRGKVQNHYMLNSLPVFAEIYVDGKKAGRSYVLADTAQLAFTSEQIDAAREAAKTVARVAIKDAVADNIEKQDQLLGALAHLILIELMEQPDLRRWETLPRWLSVARISLQRIPGKLEAVFKTDGYEIKKVPFTAPVGIKGMKAVAFVRDIVVNEEPVPAINAVLH